MNVINRLVMIVIALLLIAVPVLVLLVAFGAVSADLINTYTGYRAILEALNGISVSDFDRNVRLALAAGGVLLAIATLLLLLRELTFGRRVARNTVIDDSPGKEVLITASAVKTLAEGAAREAGATSSSASLTSYGRPYLVSCDISVPEGSDYAQIAARVRENIREALTSQSVPVKDVEVTVQGKAS